MKKEEIVLMAMKLFRKVKDSVFTFLFGQPEYTLQLYRSLHPEDTDVTMKDLHLVTLQNIITSGMYNDLGFLVRDQLIMVEAQSSFSPSIAGRLLMYTGREYEDYFDEQRIDRYSARGIPLWPGNEGYVIYPGEESGIPDVLRLSELCNRRCQTDTEVKVLRYRGTDDIIDQYIRFCRIADEERKKHGRTQEAAKEIVRICIENNILSQFMTARKKEVNGIMYSLFDQQLVMENHIRAETEAARQEGRAEGRAEGREEGREEGYLTVVKALKNKYGDAEEAARDLAFLFNLTSQAAEEEVRRYWDA